MSPKPWRADGHARRAIPWDLDTRTKAVKARFKGQTGAGIADRRPPACRRNLS